MMQINNWTAMYRRGPSLFDNQGGVPDFQQNASAAAHYLANT
jgi:hypothetical protein